MNATNSLVHRVTRAIIGELPLGVLLYVYALLPIFFGVLLRMTPSRWEYIVLITLQPIIYIVPLLLIAHYRRWLWWGVVALTSTFFAAELMCHYCQDTRITSAMAIIFMQSNVDEASEFLASGTSAVSAIKAVCITIGAVIFLVITTRLWQRSSMYHRILNRSYSLHATIFVCTTVLCIASIASIMRTHVAYINRYWARITYMAMASSPLTYTYACVDTYTEMTRIDLDALEAAIDNVSATMKPSNPPLTIVFVIGESHIKGRSSIYGYPLLTNPELQRYVDDGSLVVFDNVVTYSNGTIDVFPRLLSTQHIGDGIPYHDYALLPAVMKRAGFNTALYSNQSLLTAHDFDFGCYYFLSRKSIVDKCFNYTNSQKYDFDGSLIDQYPPLYDSSSNNFTIYHLMGQHVAAFQRYPQQATYFSPATYKAFGVTDEMQQHAMAEYDNATRYNDHVISSIIKMVADHNAVVIYCPDHGDEECDYRNVMGRVLGCTLPGTIKLHYEVPLVIWMSDKYRSLHPDIVAALRKHVNKPIYNTDIAHTIFDMANVETSAYKSKYSLTTDETDTRHRMITQQLSYDYDANRQMLDTVTMRYYNKHRGL